MSAVAAGLQPLRARPARGTPHAACAMVCADRGSPRVFIRFLSFRLVMAAWARGAVVAPSAARHLCGEHFLDRDGAGRYKHARRKRNSAGRLGAGAEPQAARARKRCAKALKLPGSVVAALPFATARGAYAAARRRMRVDELSDDEWRQRDQVELPRLLRAQRPYRRAVVPARAAQRSDPDVHQCRHGAVQERLHRPREAPLCAGRHGAEMRARRRQAQRPRQCRLYGAPPHLLRDARQFLVRRLFQGPRHRARLEPDHQGIRPRQGAS